VLCGLATVFAVITAAAQPSAIFGRACQWPNVILNCLIHQGMHIDWKEGLSSQPGPGKLLYV
jgi:hypothetical protein